MYSIQTSPKIDKKFYKLSKKSSKQLGSIYRKLEEIVNNPHHYKNLRKPLQHLKRVHVDKSFVLVFSVNETTKTIMIEDFDHHNKIYS